MVKMEKLEKLISSLKKKKVSVALAESCSGGYASYLLTKIPGASKIFKGAIVVYSLDIKHKFFKIPSLILEENKGVSGGVALSLAKGVRKKFNADLGGAIVGFAGPKARKGVRVGTAFVAVKGKSDSILEKLIIPGNRNTIQKKASSALVDLLYEYVNKK